MGHRITIELSDGANNGLAREAGTLGATPSMVAASALEEHFAKANGAPHTALTEAEAEEARLRFEIHFGEVSVPNAVRLDNQQIDADLAREYAGGYGENDAG